MSDSKLQIELPQVDLTQQAGISQIALVGNPNAGKTSLFNRLTGMRAHTANFAGTTVEHRHGMLQGPACGSVQVVDLPGLYSLTPTTPEEEVATAVLRGERDGVDRPDALIVVVDATNLERNLPLALEALELGIPSIVALNMFDLADRLGLKIDVEKLTERLGCPVVNVSARSGEGIPELIESIRTVAAEQLLPQLDEAASACASCSGCSYASRFDWAKSVREDSLSGDLQAPSRVTDALDSVLTHPVGGLLVFALIMYGTLMAIFQFASLPMDLIDGLFGWAGDTVGQFLPDGDLKSLIVDGIIGGVGGLLIFLPQICLLFFLLALLEGSGYLARASLVMDRLMRSVGLPGQAFVPMLSAHACAIPAIMATRVINNRRDRLAAILVAPLLSCTARLQVYVMVVGLLFPGDARAASLVFAGSYLLGIVAALGAAFVLKKTILPGESRALVIELPNYRLPSLKGALLEVLSQAWIFIKTAGTTILVISIVLWFLATYPKTELADLPKVTQTELAQLDEEAAEVELTRLQLERSFAGRLGRTIEPVFKPLGFDWKISVGVISSFAAREVVVSTLSILYGLGEEGDETSLMAALESATDSAGMPVFTTATCLSLLVFYVLAMQCLPTQAVTKSETGTWRWPIFQLVYMSVLAYVSALIVYQVASAMGG